MDDQARSNTGFSVTDAVALGIDLAVAAASTVIGIVSMQNLAKDDEEFQEQLAEETTNLTESETELLEVQAQIQKEKNQQMIAIGIGGVISLFVLGGFVFLTSKPAKKTRKRKESP